MKSAKDWSDIIWETHDDELVTRVKEIQADAYEAGQLDMREAAAFECLSVILPRFERYMCEAFANDIRALPIKPMTESE